MRRKQLRLRPALTITPADPLGLKSLPPLRVTAATALPTARQMVGDLAKLVRETGMLASAPTLMDDVDALARFGQDAPLLVDLRSTSDSAALSSLPGLVDFRLPNGQSVLSQVREGRSAAPVRAGTPRAAVHVWRTADVTASELAAVRGGGTDYPFLLALVPAEASIASVVSQLTDIAWHVEAVEHAAVEDVIRTRFGQGPGAASVDLLRAESLVNPLESLGSVFGIAVEQDLRALRAKRSLLQVRLTQSAASSQPRSSSEALGDIRTRLQRHFSDFSRGVEDRLGVLVAKDSQLWASLQEKLEGVALEERSRSRTVSLRLPESVTDDWTGLLRHTFLAHASADLTAMRDLFKAVNVEIEQRVTRMGGPPTTVNFQFLDESRLRRIVDQAFVPTRSYEGELPRSGIFEYAMIARRYQTILFMFLSAFGLSFLRSYREFMIPAAIVLLTLGAINVFNTVRREKVEGRLKELEKARELLRAEARRALQDAQRAWSSLVSQHLSDQLPVVFGQVESGVRDYLSRSGEDAALERQRVQRQLQGQETNERRLQAALKTRELILNALAQLRGELKQLLTVALRNATAP